jgi:hypothetical protein
MKTRDVKILLIKMQERLTTLTNAENQRQSKEQKHAYTLRISELNLAISAVEAIIKLHVDKKKEKKEIKKLAKHGHKRHRKSTTNDNKD